MLKAKDSAFLKITELQNDLQQFQEEVTKEQQANEHFQQVNKTNIHNNAEMLKIQKKEQSRMKALIDSHKIKLNSTGNYSTNSPWALHSDTEAYPILKSTNHLSHFSRLPKALENITLEADDISSVQQFYDSINTAIMTILSSNDFLPEYTELSQNFDYKFTSSH